MSGKTKWAVACVVWLATLLLLGTWYRDSRDRVVAIAAGPKSGEAFGLATTIAEVFESAGLHIRLEVYETAGSAQNVQLLESGQVGLATISSNTTVRGGIAAIASLYFDAFQLVVAESSDIFSFPGIKGHRIAIGPNGSGQNESFWLLAEHYGLTRQMLTAQPISDDAADFGLVRGYVDAIFRVRAPGNAAVRRLVREYPTRIVPIRHAAALALRMPALSPGVLPEGAYRGDPPLPPADVPTVILERLLVARTDLEDGLVHEITRSLFEMRPELVHKNILAGFLTAPDADGRASLPLHAGALRYHDREKPTFVEQNTRLLSGALYVIAILTSAFFALRGRYQRSRKIRMSDYNARLMTIVGDARTEADRASLLNLREQLVDILGEVVADLGGERVGADEFDHFSFTWQAADAFVRDQILLVEAR